MKYFFLFWVMAFAVSCSKSTSNGVPSESFADTLEYDVDLIPRDSNGYEIDSLWFAYHKSSWKSWVRVLELPQNQNYDYWDVHVSAIVDHEDTLIILTDDKCYFHAIRYEESYLRNHFKGYEIEGSVEGDVPYDVFFKKDKDYLIFMRMTDDKLLDFLECSITTDIFSVGPFHVGMSLVELAEKVDIKFNKLERYHCLAILADYECSLLNNKFENYRIRYPGESGPEYARIFITFSDTVQKLNIIETNNTGKFVLDTETL